MTTGMIHCCTDARPRRQAPLARAVMPVSRAALVKAPTGVLGFGGFAFGGTGPDAAP